MKKQNTEHTFSHNEENMAFRYLTGTAVAYSSQQTNKPTIKHYY